MLRRLWISLQRDSRINLRNHFLTITLLVAGLYIVAVRWLIPADTSLKPDVYVVDRTAEGCFAAYVQSQDTAGKAHLLDSTEALREAMLANKNSVGIALTEGQPLPSFTLYFQGHENAKVRNLLALSVEEELRQAYGLAQPASVTIDRQTLRGQGAQDVPFNELMVPFLLFSDTSMLGFVFIAALIFMEKEEGTLKAYLVTPGRTWEYLLSKALTLAGLALLFTLIVAPLTLGAGPNYLQLVVAMALGSILGALLAACVAVFFDNFSQFLFPAVVLLVVLGAPGVAYLVPSFAPVWLRWLPTYPLAFALREAAFPTGSSQIVVGAALTMLALDVALLAVSSVVFNRRLAHES